MNTQHPPQQLHTPVLLQETVALLAPQVNETYLDLTAGYGGHAQAIVEKTGGRATLVDRDENAIQHLRSLNLKGVTLLHRDFASAAQQLVHSGQTFDMVLVDLGVSSPQFDRAERGFSFRADAPLDMRMDAQQEKTAAELVNNLSQKELADIIVKYGEEKPRTARTIAQAIVDARPLHTTHELADIIKQHIRSWGKKIHPATRTFQALRIATNDELTQLERLLPLIPELLNSGGRVAIISFHSLEDRRVKHYLKFQENMGYEAELEPITKHPIKGSTADVHNPRARSAMLRGAAKIKR